MKANELMIGDWVRCCTDPKPFRITDIETEWGTPYFCVTGTDCLAVDGGDLQPIPITEEILEKNEFQRMEHTDPWNGKINVQYMLEIGDMDCVIYVPEGKSLYAKHMLGERYEIDNVKYVHELQHALRIGEFNHININL